MKSIFFAFICVFMLNSCKKTNEETPKESKETPKMTYSSFGKEIIADDAIAVKSMAEHYKIMKSGDSIQTKMIAKVEEAC